jgi:hypothetical protein
MDGEYSQEWAELRRLRRRLGVVAVSEMGIFVLVPFARFVPGGLAKALGFGLFAAWVVVTVKLFVFQADYTSWPCPGCGK